MSWNWISKLEELRKSGRPFVCVTVTQCSGSTPREVGAKMLCLESGEFFGTIGGGHLEQLALEDAKKCLAEKASRNIKYPLGAKAGQCCGGVVELLFEALNTGPLLYLFGAGHVGQALARTLIGTPFTVHLVDEREEWINSTQIPGDVVRHHANWEDFVDGVEWDAERTYAAVMTFRHDMDERIIENILVKARPARYVGLIGSRLKWERFKRRMSDRAVPEEGFAKIHCPIGLEIGGKAPQEVAISVSAELLKVHYGK